jgi:hypothetical protein
MLIFQYACWRASVKIFGGAAILYGIADEENTRMIYTSVLRKHLLGGFFSILALLLLPFSASAVTTGSYTLSNHPDANQTPPPYGLRLDGLLGNSVYTFDFNNGDMQMTYDGSSIHIFGTAFGGADGGGAYTPGTTAIWNIDFTFDTGVTQPGGEGGLNDIVVDDPTGHHTNFGTISSSFGSFDLRSHGNGSETFTLGDEDGTTGHRNFAGISGWGWLDFSTDGGITWDGGKAVGDTADFIFTAAPVPVPAAVWLFASGLLGLVGFARKH